MEKSIPNNKIRSVFFRTVEGLHMKIYVLLATVYLVRYLPVFQKRIIMWDDFFLLSSVATIPRFKHAVLYTFLHFMPFLRLSMFGMIQLIPLENLRLATSLWNFFWVAFFCFSFIRLFQIYIKSNAVIALMLAFVLLNPLFTEDQIWLTSSYYLVAHTLSIEGLVQFQKAIIDHKRWRWFFAVLLSILSPTSWSTGFLTPILYLAVAFFDWKEIKSKKVAALVIISAFLGYPILRIIGESVAGSTYLQVTPWNPWTAFMASSRMLGDGLFFGSFGVWNKHPPGRLIPAFASYIGVLLFILLLGTLFKRKRKKEVTLIFILTWVAIGVPLFFRGTQFGYDDLRWFVRYYTAPLTGAALAFGLGLSFLEKRSPLTFKFLCGLIFLTLSVVTFTNRMLEHYATAAQLIPLNIDQNKQMRHLAKIANIAFQNEVGADALISRFFIPIVGNVGTHNTLGLYKGIHEPNAEPMSTEAVDAIEDYYATSQAWKDFAAKRDSAFIFNPFLPLTALTNSIPKLKWRKCRTPPISVESGLSLKESSQNIFLMNSAKDNGKLKISLESGCHKIAGMSLKLVTPEKSAFRLTFEFLPTADSPYRISTISTEYANQNEVPLGINLQRMPWIPKVEFKEVYIHIASVPDSSQPFVPQIKLADLTLYPAAQDSSSQ